MEMRVPVKTTQAYVFVEHGTDLGRSLTLRKRTQVSSAVKLSDLKTLGNTSDFFNPAEIGSVLPRSGNQRLRIAVVASNGTL